MDDIDALRAEIAELRRLVQGLAATVNRLDPKAPQRNQSAGGLYPHIPQSEWTDDMRKAAEQFQNGLQPIDPANA